MALLATSASASSLVLNGGFTTGDFTNWNNTDRWVVTAFPPNPGTPPSGTIYAASTGCSGAACNDPVVGAYISQTLATVASQSYTLTFFYDAGGTNADADSNTTELDALWNGSLVSGGQIIDAAPGTWAEYTFTGLIASGSSTVLEFTGRQDPEYLFLTDVSVTADSSTAPEPASLTLIGGGLLSLWTMGTLLRRRRKA